MINRDLGLGEIRTAEVATQAVALDEDGSVDVLYARSVGFPSASSPDALETRCRIGGIGGSHLRETCFAIRGICGATLSVDRFTVAFVPRGHCGALICNAFRCSTGLVVLISRSFWTGCVPFALVSRIAGKAFAPANSELVGWLLLAAHKTGLHRSPRKAPFPAHLSGSQLAEGCRRMTDGQGTMLDSETQRNDGQPSAQPV